MYVFFSMVVYYRIFFYSSITLLVSQQLVLNHTDCLQIFEGGDRHVGNQRVELVWQVFIFITFSEQLHMDLVCNIPYSFGPDSFVESGVDVHIWSSHLLHGKFPNFFECPRSMLLKTRSMDVLVNVDSVFSDHHLIDGRPALLLLAALLCGSHLNKTR